MRFCRGACPHARSAMRSCRGACPHARPAMRFCWGVLRSARVRRCGFGGVIGARRASGVAVLLGRFALGSCLLFAAWRQTGRLAICFVSILPGRDRHSRVLDASARLSAFVGSLRVEPFISGDHDGLPGTRGTGLAARPLYSFARAYWLCGVFRGEYVGAKCGSRTAAAPDCAKESNVEAALPPLWMLFTLRRGWGGAGSQRRRPGTRKDLTGSDLWPVRSGCIAMLPTRSNVQTRAALKRRGVGLRARSGVEATLRLAGRVGLYCDVTNSHNRRPA